MRKCHVCGEIGYGAFCYVGPLFAVPHHCELRHDLGECGSVGRRICRYCNPCYYNRTDETIGALRSHGDAE